MRRWFGSLYGGGKEVEATPAMDPALVRQRAELLARLEFKKELMQTLDKTLADSNLADTQFTNLFGNSPWDPILSKSLMWQASSAVYACFQCYLRACRTVRWVVRKKDPKQWIEDTKLPVGRVMRYPNRSVSAQRMRDRVVIDMLNDGMAYWRILRASTDGPPKELWPIDSSHVDPIKDPNTFLRHYLVKKGSVFGGRSPFAPINQTGGMEVRPEDMIVFMMENPADIYRGMSPVQAGRRVIEADSNALRWWGNQIRKGTKKSGILSVKHEYSDEEFTDANQMVRRDLQGPQNVGGIMLLGQEHTYTPLDQKPQELDYSGGREGLRREIASLFAVPPPMIGDMSTSTYNNMQIARMIFWLDTIIPFLDIQKDALNFHLLNPTLPDDQWDDYEIDYDLKGVEALLQVFGQRLDHALKMRKCGTPLHLIFESLQIPVPRFDGDEVGWLEMNLAPVPALIERGNPAQRNVPSNPQNHLPMEVIKDPLNPPDTNPDQSVLINNPTNKPEGNQLSRRSL